MSTKFRAFLKDAGIFQKRSEFCAHKVFPPSKQSAAFVAVGFSFINMGVLRRVIFRGNWSIFAKF